MAVNSLFTVHAVGHTASTGAQEAAQSTRATHLGAQDRSRDLTGATNRDVPNPTGFQPSRTGKGLKSRKMVERPVSENGTMQFPVENWCKNHFAGSLSLSYVP